MSIDTTLLLTAIERCRDADIQRAKDGNPCFILIDKVGEGGSGPRFTLVNVANFWSNLSSIQRRIVRKYRQHKLANPVVNWTALSFETDGALVTARGRYATLAVPLN